MDSFWRISMLRQGLIVIGLAVLLVILAVLTLSNPWLQVLAIALINLSAGIVLYASLMRVVRLLSQGVTATLDYREFPVELHRLVYTVAVERYALVESRQLLESILEAVPSGVLVTDHQGTVVIINTALEKIFEVTRAQVLGKSLESVKGFLGCSDECCPLYEILKTGAEQQGESALVLEEKTLELEYSSFVVKGPQGEHLFLLVVNDATSRRAMERHTLQAGKMRLVEQLAGSVAHEVRNPLTTIRGFCQLFASKPEFQTYKKTLDLMVSEADHASDIIASYLTLARQNPSQIQEGDLNELVNSCIQLLEPLARKKNVSVLLSQEPLPKLRIDKTAVKQLCLHLLKNAIEAVPVGGNIRCATKVTEDSVSLVIEDDGPGFPLEILNRVGEPFLTTKDNNSGLGLAVCKQVVNEHGGEFLVTSQLGQGTSVQVLLPLQTKYSEAV